MSRPAWDNQFAETDTEKRERFARRNERRSLQAHFAAKLRTLVLDFEQAGLAPDNMAEIMAAFDMTTLSAD